MRGWEGTSGSSADPVTTNRAPTRRASSASLFFFLFSICSFRSLPDPCWYDANDLICILCLIYGNGQGARVPRRAMMQMICFVFCV